MFSGKKSTKGKTKTRWIVVALLVVLLAGYGAHAPKELSADLEAGAGLAEEAIAATNSLYTEATSVQNENSVASISSNQAVKASATSSKNASADQGATVSKAPRVADSELLNQALESADASVSPDEVLSLEQGLQSASNGGETPSQTGESAVAGTASSQEDTSQGTDMLCLDVNGALCEVPAFNGLPAVEINGNQPAFTPEELAQACVESYANLDKLGRCGSALAHVCEVIMPTEERGDISSVHPTGWQSVQYDFIDGGSLYNRGHLIGFQLAGENANEKNLITSTRYMNVEGMLPYENQVAGFVKSTGMSVLLRVTPIFEGDNLVASGVVMEAMSVEDAGAGLAFNVYCYNVQPGVVIDYATGDNQVDPDTLAAQMLAAAEGSEGFEYVGTTADGGTTDAATAASQGISGEVAGQGADSSAESTFFYVANLNTKKFHYPTCSSVSDMAAHNRWDFEGPRDELINQGYVPCKRCNP